MKCLSCDGKGWKKVLREGHNPAVEVLDSDYFTYFTAICKSCKGTGKSDIIHPTMKWNKKKKMNCGMFYFRVEPTHPKKKYRKWSWYETTTSWSDCKEYSTAEEAMIGCEKWLVIELKRMIREVGNERLA